MSRVTARGGKLEPVTTIGQGELSHRWPDLLPDGKTILFSIWNDAGWEASRIVARSPERSAQSLVVESGGGYPRYIRDTGQRGYLVYARSEGLLAAPFDESSLAVTGQAVPLVDGVITNLYGGAHFDLSPSGTLAYVPGAFGESERELLWVARDGKASPGLKMRGLTRTWQLSPDGMRVLRNNALGQGDIWIEDLTSGQSSRLTNSPEVGNFNGVWSPDGKSVIFARGLGQTDIFRRPADGRNVEDRLTATSSAKAPMSVSPDGRWLLYYVIDPISSFDIWVLELPSGTAAAGSALPQARPFVQSNAYESFAVFSPDWKWVAYQSNDAGRFEVFVRSFPDGQKVVRLSADGGISQAWSPSGGELFYRDLKGRMIAVTLGPGAPFDATTQRVLFDAFAYESVYDVSPDGQRLLMMPLIASEQSATQVNLVLNFLTELRQRVR